MLPVADKVFIGLCVIVNCKYICAIHLLQIDSVLHLKIKRKLGALCTKVDMRDDLVSFHGVI